MTGAELLDHSTQIASMIAAVGSLVTAVGTYMNGRAALKNRAVGERSVAVSERNGEAIAAVQETLHNGIGEKIAAKTIEHIVPVLKEQATVAADEVKRVAAETADELKAITLEERRFGLADRRVGPSDRRAR